MLNVLTTQHYERFLIWANERNESLNCSFSLDANNAKAMCKTSYIMLIWDIECAYYIFTDENRDKVIINPDGYPVDTQDVIDNMPEFKRLVTMLSLELDA